MIRVMIVEEMDMLRGALSAILASENDIEVVAQYASDEEAFASTHAHRPDVTVMGVPQCDEDGLAAARKLRERMPQCGILVLTARQTVDGLRHVLSAGLRGFLDQDVPPSHLIEAVRKIAAGDWAIDPVLAVATLHPDRNPLTRRQREVLRLAGAGLPAAEIAKQLFLSPGTVRNYLSAAVRKTDSRTILEAIRRAEQAGWL